MLPPVCHSSVISIHSMGSGASTSASAAEEKIRASRIISQVGEQTEGPERIDLLKELWKLCDDDNYKLPLVEESDLLKILLTILNEIGEINEDKRLAASCLWYLSRGVNVRLPIMAHAGMISALVRLAQCNDHEARLIALKTFANLTIYESCEDYILNPNIDFGAALADAINAGLAPVQ